LLAVAAALALAGTAHGGGFSIYEAGARATGLGCAFTATADDGSALFYNPAGLAFLEGRALDLNAMPVSPQFEFAGASTDGYTGSTNESVHQSFVIPGVFYTSNLGDWAYGVGIYAPFGLGVEWKDPETWVGRQVSYDVDIATLYVTPAVSYRLHETLALAIGADVAWQTIDLNRMTLHPTLGTNALDTEIEGTSKLNITPAAGLMFRPVAALSFGVMYHHKKTLEYRDGDATIKNLYTTANPGYPWAATLLDGIGGSNQKLDADLKLPWILSFGLSYRFTPRVRAEFDAVRWGWSEFDALVLNFQTEALRQAITFDYKDVWQWRFGLEVGLTEQLTALGGYVRDNTPQPIESISPLLPDADRNDYSLGLQYAHEEWLFTLSYMAVIAEKRSNIVDGRPAFYDEIEKRDTYPAGEYSSVANIVGIGIGYQF
jgi:long-chain fatty acid transport protein